MHNYFRKKLPWYRQWHEQWIHGPTHWAIFASAIVTSISLFSYVMQSAPGEAIVSSIIPPASAQVSGTPVTQCGKLSQASTTYVLQNDVTADDTCFTLAAHNIILDLNGKTITYGNGFAVGIPNAGFEQGAGTIPSSWDISQAPGATRQPKLKYWESYELQVAVSANVTQTIKSPTITLPANKSFNAFAWIEGRSDAADSATLRVINASTGEVLATKVTTTSTLDRGFAADIPAVKFTSPTNVYLELALVAGAATTFYVDQVDIKPTRTYGVAAYDYQNTTLFPDMPALSIVNSTNDTVRNGTIRQGNGQGTRSPAVKLKTGAKVFDLTVTANSINTPVLDFEWSDFEVRRVTIDHDSIGVFNRMSPVALVSGGNGTGQMTVTDSTLRGGAQVGILFGGRAPTGALAENNVIANHEKVTNGYAILVNGGRNFIIRNNTITPVYGRGILLDTAGNLNNENGQIYGNTIEVREVRNHEYPESGLTAAAVRIREFPGYHNSNIHVHDNTIRAYTGAGMVDGASGINLNLMDTGTSVVIEDNDVRAWTTAAGKHAYAIEFQATHSDYTRVVVRDNTFESNDAVVRLGNSDGFDTSNNLLERNILLKGSIPFSGFRTVHTGYSSGTELGNIFRDSVYGVGTSPTDVGWEGSGQKNLTIQWTLQVRTVNGSGAPVEGATVELRDASNTVVHSNTTSAAGTVQNPVTVTTHSGTYTKSTAQATPHMLTIAAPGFTTFSQPLTLTAATQYTVNLATGGVTTAPLAPATDTTAPGRITDLRAL